MALAHNYGPALVTSLLYNSRLLDVVVRICVKALLALSEIILSLALLVTCHSARSLHMCCIVLEEKEDLTRRGNVPNELMTSTKAPFSF